MSAKPARLGPEELLQLLIAAAVNNDQGTSLLQVLLAIALVWIMVRDEE